MRRLPSIASSAVAGQRRNSAQWCSMSAASGCQANLDCSPAQLTSQQQKFWRTALRSAVHHLATAEDPLLPWLAQETGHTPPPGRCLCCEQLSSDEVQLCLSATKPYTLP